VDWRRWCQKRNTSPFFYVYIALDNSRKIEKTEPSATFEVDTVTPNWKPGDGE